MFSKMMAGLLAVALVASAMTVQAKITIDTVPVGDAGNTADTALHSGNSAGQGAVSYNYQIAKYEVTAGQYTAFLNAVGGVDTYALYNTEMSNTSYGSGITRSGSSGSYTYSVAANFVNRPVNFVSFGDAIRFTNWLQNGQPTGAQSLATTESGTYTLNTDLMAVAVPDATQRATWAATGSAHWLLPSEDEWYKSSYYKGGGTNAGYWNFPTRSNTAPGNNMADPLGNNANIYTGSGSYPIDSGKYTTLVGEFQNSASPYGTFDQGGNVWEWNEAVFFGSWRCLRGGSFDMKYPGNLASSDRDISFVHYPPYGELPDIGFRVASVPEPGSIALLLSCAVAFGIWRRVTA